MILVRRVDYRSLDYFLSSVDVYPSTENFKLLTNVLDLAIRTFHNIKISILKGFQDFKRSELKAYHESHVLAISSLYKNKRLSILNTSIPRPYNMIVTYGQALAIINDALTKLNMDNTLDIANGIISHLAIDLQGDSLDYKKLIDRYNEATSKISKFNRQEIDVLIKSIISQDNKKTQSDEVPANTMFTSFTQIKDIDDSLLKYEPLFVKVAHISLDINNLEYQVNETIRHIVKFEKLDRDYLKSFHAFIYAFAVQIDTFGVLLNILQQIEHNFVITLARLTETNSSI
jgi:hypothetical protein